jgi:hypothetical protein
MTLMMGSCQQSRYEEPSVTRGLRDLPFGQLLGLLYSGRHAEMYVL